MGAMSLLQAGGRAACPARARLPSLRSSPAAPALPPPARPRAGGWRRRAAWCNAQHQQQKEAQTQPEAVPAPAGPAGALVGEDAAVFDLSQQSLQSWAIFGGLLAGVSVLLYGVRHSPQGRVAGAGWLCGCAACMRAGVAGQRQFPPPSAFAHGGQPHYEIGRCALDPAAAATARPGRQLLLAPFPVTV